MGSVGVRVAVGVTVAGGVTVAVGVAVTVGVAVAGAAASVASFFVRPPQRGKLSHKYAGTGSHGEQPRSAPVGDCPGQVLRHYQSVP